MLMKAVIFSLFGKLIPKRRLLSPGRKTDDILQRGRKINKIGEYYYIRYATSALRVIAWIILIVGVIGSIIWGITTGEIEGGLLTVLGIIGSFLAWLLLLAARELLKLFMDVKENTGNTAERATIIKKPG
jgi:TRAP-type mannitol/chloroaromatic compound transport system permease large subunit